MSADVRTCPPGPPSSASTRPAQGPVPRQATGPPRLCQVRQNALGVRGSRAAYPVSASLGPRNDNLANVAWSGSLRIHVDVHNQALLLRRLIELPVAGPVEQRHCRVILDILAGA